MAQQIIITKRFRNNTLKVYQYLLREFSAKTAFNFLDNLEKRIEFIAGKASEKRRNIRSLLFTPHNQIFYRTNKDTIEILCLFDMRKHPRKKPY